MTGHLGSNELSTIACCGFLFDFSHELRAGCTRVRTTDLKRGASSNFISQLYVLQWARV
jgi:hypothetical protein